MERTSFPGPPMQIGVGNEQSSPIHEDWWEVLIIPLPLRQIFIPSKNLYEWKWNVHAIHRSAWVGVGESSHPPIFMNGRGVFIAYTNLHGWISKDLPFHPSTCMSGSGVVIPCAHLYAWKWSVHSIHQSG